MSKLKVSFTIKVTDEIDLNESAVQKIKELQSKGESILLVDELKQDIADNFNINVSCVEVLEHIETIVEGEGE